MKLYTMNWILLMILSAVWGGAFTLNKQALETFTPEFIVAGRLIVGSIVLLILVFIIHKKIIITIKQWPYFIYEFSWNCGSIFINSIWSKKY